MAKTTKSKKTVREIPSKKKDKRRSTRTPTPPKDGATYERMRQATRAIPKVKKKVRRRMEEHDEEVQRLTEENETLRARLDALENGEVNATPAPKWKKGLLPGNQYIKTDPATGDFKKIDKAEWDTLA